MWKALSMALFLVSVCGNAQAVEVDLAKIATIESSNNPKAYNKSSEAVGMYQITLICLKDYNLAHIRGGYNHDEMYEPIKAQKVAEWYLNYRIPQMLKHYGITYTNDKEFVLYSISCYNWGIGNVVRWFKDGGHYNELPKETREYYEKYSRM